METYLPASLVLAMAALLGMPSCQETQVYPPHIDRELHPLEAGTKEKSLDEVTRRLAGVKPFYEEDLETLARRLYVWPGLLSKKESMAAAKAYQAMPQSKREEIAWQLVEVSRHSKNHHEAYEQTKRIRYGAGSFFALDSDFEGRKLTEQDWERIRSYAYSLRPHESAFYCLWPCFILDAVVRNENLPRHQRRAGLEAVREFTSHNRDGAAQYYIMAEDILEIIGDCKRRGR